MEKLSSTKGAWSGPAQQLEGCKCLVFGSGGIGGRYDANKAGWGDLPLFQGLLPYMPQNSISLSSSNRWMSNFFFFFVVPLICWAYGNFPREIKGYSGWLGVGQEVDLMEIQYSDAVDRFLLLTRDSAWSKRLFASSRFTHLFCSVQSKLKLENYPGHRRPKRHRATLFLSPSRFPSTIFVCLFVCTCQALCIYPTWIIQPKS